MVSIEDRVLGGRRENYCSSDEEEGDELVATKDQKVVPPQVSRTFQGVSTNTGPKGVIEDARRFKQLETERRAEQDAEFVALSKKFALTCRSERDEQEQREREKNGDKDDVFRELEELEDEFMKEYRQKRMREMLNQKTNVPTFGKVFGLESSMAFLDAIDKESPEVTIVVHLYEVGAPGCSAMNGCLICLATEYPYVKFCSMQASKTQHLSKKFLSQGVPALLIYRGADLMASFVQLFKEFGDDFYATEVESYLVEHGVLPDKSLVPKIIQTGSCLQNGDDSDYDID